MFTMNQELSFVILICLILFFREPRNLFRNGSCHDASDDSQVWTGTYFISTRDFIRFLEWSDLKMMCDQSISIEYYLRTF